MPSTWRGMQYVEYTDREMPFASPIESFANDGSTAERILDLINYTRYANVGGTTPDRGDAVNKILGYPTILPTGLTGARQPIGYINRLTPMPHPYWVNHAGKYSLYCTKINRIEGHSTAEWVIQQTGAQSSSTFNQMGLKDTSNGDGNDLPNYQYARMRLGFETLTYDILEDSDPAVNGSDTFGFPDESTCSRYVTKTYGTSTDYVTLGNSTMRFVGAGGGPTGVVNFTVGKIIVTYDLSFRWELVPKNAIGSLAINHNLDPTLACIDNALGKVNDSTFPSDASGAGGFAAGTLLLLGASIVPIRSAVGDRLYSVEYKFKFFKPGHHQVYSILSPGPPIVNGFVEISSDGATHAIGVTTPDGVHVYDVANFDALFQPCQAS